MGLTEQEGQQAASVVQRLRESVTAARVDVVTTFAWDSAAKDASMNALGAVGQNISTLEGALLDRVKRGEKSFEWWMAQAKSIFDSISYYADVGSWSFSSVVAGTVVQTASDVKTGAEKLAPEVVNTTKWLVVGVVAFAVIYVVSFAKSLKPG